MFAAVADTSLKVNTLLKKSGKKQGQDDKDDAAPAPVVDPHDAALVRIAAEAEAVRIRIKASKQNIVHIDEQLRQLNITRRYQQQPLTLFLDAINLKSSYAADEELAELVRCATDELEAMGRRLAERKEMKAVNDRTIMDQLVDKRQAIRKFYQEKSELAKCGPEFIFNFLAVFAQPIHMEHLNSRNVVIIGEGGKLEYWKGHEENTSIKDDSEAVFTREGVAPDIHSSKDGTARQTTQKKGVDLQNNVRQNKRSEHGSLHNTSYAEKSTVERVVAEEDTTVGLQQEKEVDYYADEFDEKGVMRESMQQLRNGSNDDGKKHEKEMKIPRPAFSLEDIRASKPSNVFKLSDVVRLECGADITHVVPLYADEETVLYHVSLLDISAQMDAPKHARGVGANTVGGKDDSPQVNMNTQMHQSADGGQPRETNPGGPPDQRRRMLTQKLGPDGGLGNSTLRPDSAAPPMSGTSQAVSTDGDLSAQPLTIKVRRPPIPVATYARRHLFVCFRDGRVGILILSELLRYENVDPSTTSKDKVKEDTRTDRFRRKRETKEEEEIRLEDERIAEDVRRMKESLETRKHSLKLSDPISSSPITHVTYAQYAQMVVLGTTPIAVKLEHDEDTPTNADKPAIVALTIPELEPLWSVDLDVVRNCAVGRAIRAVPQNVSSEQAQKRQTDDLDPVPRYFLRALAVDDSQKQKCVFAALASGDVVKISHQTVQQKPQVDQARVGPTVTGGAPARKNIPPGGATGGTGALATAATAIAKPKEKIEVIVSWVLSVSSNVAKREQTGAGLKSSTSKIDSSADKETEEASSVSSVISSISPYTHPDSQRAGLAITTMDGILRIFALETSRIGQCIAVERWRFPTVDNLPVETSPLAAAAVELTALTARAISVRGQVYFVGYRHDGIALVFTSDSPQPIFELRIMSPRATHNTGTGTSGVDNHHASTRSAGITPGAPERRASSQVNGQWAATSGSNMQRRGNGVDSTAIQQPLAVRGLGKTIMPLDANEGLVVFSNGREMALVSLLPLAEYMEQKRATQEVSSAAENETSRQGGSGVLSSKQ